MTKHDSPLIPDAPILSRKDDLFGRAKFAENLAKSIAGVPAEDGFVFALNATWGSGKTSTLNMIREALEGDAKVNDGKQFVVFEFNPWWFSGGDSLAQGFLGQFSEAMRKHGKVAPDYREKLNNIADGIDAFAGTSAIAGAIAEPNVAAIAATVGKGAKFFACALKRSSSGPAKDIHEIRDNIQKLLRESDLRVLVVMDDLDRIQPNEICEMFRLIKGVADFPNTIYLLPFDRKAVAAAVAHQSFHSDEMAAEEYLEKIIQAPLDLPPIHRWDIVKYFFPKVLEIVGMSPHEWERRHLKDPLAAKKSDLFHRHPIGGEDPGIAFGFLNTVRDAKRWLNGIITSYPPVKGKVDLVDFIALQGLRVFAPSVYRDVWDKKELFVPKYVFSEKEKAVSELVKRANDLRNSMIDNKNPRVQIAQDILQLLFPYWECLTENDRAEMEKRSWITGMWTSSYCPEKWVGNKASFDNYFIFPPANAPAPSAEPRRNS